MNISEWVSVARRPDVFRRSRKVALLVGTILIFINYFDKIFTGALVNIDFIKMALTYCVPFCVSTHASVSAIIQHEKDKELNEKV